MDELIERLEFWKQGPDFLKRPLSEWPKQPSPAEKSQDETQGPADEESVEEIDLYFSQLKALEHETAEVSKVNVLAAQETAPKDPIGLGRLLGNCSSLQTIRGAITRIKRLAKKAKGRPVLQSALTPEEVDFADILLA